jgi:hypothetical protein
VDGCCFSCEHKNAQDQLFCGACGAPLSLSSFVSKQVDARLSEATRDRQIVETESAIRIFETAFGWAKLVAGVGAALLAILAIGATWRFIDLRSAANSAQIAVNDTRGAAEKSITDVASTTQSEIAAKSAESVKAIQAAANSASESSKKAQQEEEAQGNSISKQATKVREDFQSQAATVTKDVASAREQIQAASQLQPQMQAMQGQLTAAQAQITEQQRVITSSADFAKQIFSSHQQVTFERRVADKRSFAIIPIKRNLSTATEPNTPPADALYLLLPNVPVASTVQIQFNQTVASPNSFVWFHNLLVAFIDKSAEDFLLGKPVTISYFPDPEDTNLIHKIEVQDGRVFADGEAIPKIGDDDPTFRGSKWFPANQPSAATPIIKTTPRPPPK